MGTGWFSTRPRASSRGTTSRRTGSEGRKSGFRRKIDYILYSNYTQSIAHPSATAILRLVLRVKNYILAFLKRHRLRLALLGRSILQLETRSVRNIANFDLRPAVLSILAYLLLGRRRASLSNASITLKWRIVKSRGVPVGWTGPIGTPVDGTMSWCTSECKNGISVGDCHWSILFEGRWLVPSIIEIHFGRTGTLIYPHAFLLFILLITCIRQVFKLIELAYIDRWASFDLNRCLQWAYFIICGRWFPLLVYSIPY